MVVLAITILLAVAGVAVMPCWRHSAGWGYRPGACIGLLLLGLGVSTALGRSAGPDMPVERLAASARPAMIQETTAVE